MNVGILNIILVQFLYTSLQTEFKTYTYSYYLSEILIFEGSKAWSGENEEEHTFPYEVNRDRER